MTPRRLGLGLALSVLAAAGGAHAASPSLRCTLQPRHPVLGHPLRWTIRAVNLPELPLLRAAQLAPDWLLQGQTAQRSASGRGRSSQILELTLYPMAIGTLRLPALHAGTLSCPRRALRIASSAHGQAPQFMAAHVGDASPVVGQAVRVDLNLGAGGALDWQPVRAASDDGVVRPLSTLSTEVVSRGGRVAVQRQSWSFTPLRAGDTTIHFGLLRATPFGQLRVYPLAPLHLRAQPLPAYWPDDAAIGHARWRIERAPQRLQLGANGVLHATLGGVQIGRAALLRALVQATGSELGLRLYPPRLRREPGAAHALTPVWHVALAFRVDAAGPVVYPRLRLPYYDPRRGAPALAVADWGGAQADDPRPARLLAAIAAVGALVLLLALLRLATLAARAALCRRRWRRLIARGDARALAQVWQRQAARASPQAPTPTLRSWVRSQRCGGRPLTIPGLEGLIAVEERRRYAAAQPDRHTAGAAQRSSSRRQPRRSSCSRRQR